MSQIIPLGIGSPAEIKQLVLTGLSPGVLPPPPVPGASQEFQVIGPGQVAYSFQDFTSAVYTDGIEWTLPPRAVQITWECAYDSEPSQTQIALQVSVDGEHWAQIDISTNTDGEIRTVKTSAIFIRVAMLDIEPGIITNVNMRIQPMEWLEQ